MAQATLTEFQMPSATDSGRPSTGRRTRFALAAVSLFVIATWFAPAILARSSLRHRFVHAVVADYRGGATVEAASLGWFSPVTLRNVVLTDDEDVTLAAIGELTTSRSLSSLLFAAGDDLGTITLRKPRVTVRIRPDGSNLEDMVRPLLESEGSGAGMTVVIEDGAIAWTSVRGEACPGGFENIGGTVRQAPGASLPGLIDLQATLSDGERRGELSLSFKTGDRTATEPRSEANVKATALPLAPLQPWCDRFRFGISADGSVSADILATAPAEDATAWPIDGWIEGQALRITPDAAARPFLLERLTLKAKGTVDRDHVELEKAAVQSDVGTGELAGRWAFATVSDTDTWIGLVRALIEQETRLTASIDLARLSAQLPPTVRTSHSIESGQIGLSVQSSGSVGDRVGAIHLSISDIVAGDARQFVWRSPLGVEALVRCGASAITVESLKATSDFLTVTGAGSTSDADLTFEADLDKLRLHLESMFEIRQESFAGRISGRIRLQQAGEGRSHIEAQAVARDLSLALSGTGWREKELKVAMQADVSMTNAAVQSVQTGRIEVRSVDDDELIATLSKPVSLDDVSEWAFGVHAKGEIARWLSRARACTNLVPRGDWDVGGSLDASATVQYGQNGLSVNDLVADATALRIRRGRQSIDEPRVRLTGNAGWNADGLLSIPNARLISETASIDLTKLSWPVAGDQPASGQLSFRAGIGRVSRYVVSEQPTVWLSGVASGTADLRVDSSTTVLNGKIDLERPVLTRPATDPNGRRAWQPVWSDDRASIVLSGRFTHATETLTVNSCRIVGSGLTIDAAGRVERPTSVALADLAGSMTCDLEALSARFEAGLPEGVVVSGRGAKPFVLRGPLFSAAGLDPQLSARAGFGWDRAELWGFSIGTGEVFAGLNDRTIAIEPFEWPVGTGRLRGSATIGLADQSVLSVPKGRVAERVVLSPEVCRTWLRYAAPALADSTTVEGTASIDVEGCTVPLARPEATEARGVLAIHSAAAVPGSFAKSLLDVVRQIQTIAGNSPTNGSDLRLVASEQSVAVRVSGGRVYHDRFTVHIGDETGPAIATTGSVGFDQSIDLVAEVPLDRGWFRNERVAAALGGQVLRVPIRGTLSSPTPDPRALQSLGSKAATGAIEGLLDKEVEKQIGEPLRKLFD